MFDIISEKFSQWAKGGNPLEARISVFQKIRDIPYAVIPEIIHPQKYLELLRIDIPIEWPLELEKLAQEMPVNTHLALRVEIEDDFVLVDATLDPKLKMLGLPINDWDGKSNTLLPIQPLGEEVWYSPEERGLMGPNFEERSLVFYQKLNSWLEKVREGESSS